MARNKPAGKRATRSIASKSRSTGLRQIVDRLKAELAQAEEAESKAHERVEALRIALREIEAFMGKAPQPRGANDAPATSRRRRRATTSSTRGRRRKSLAENLKNIMASRPGPWRATEIISQARASGKLAGLSNPSQAVRAALRRMVEAGELKHVARGLYALSGGTEKASA
jgi:hypothetical protein